MTALVCIGVLLVGFVLVVVVGWRIIYRFDTGHWPKADGFHGLLGGRER